MFDLDVVITGLPGLKKSQLNAIHKDAWLHVGRTWRNRFLGRHFLHRWARKYGYALRKGERPGASPIPRTYTWYKAKRQGHTRPLEYHGTSRRLAETQRKLRATRESCKVLLPQGYNRRHPRSEARMNDEIRAVLPEELTILQREWIARLTKRVERVAKGKSFRIRAWH